MPTFRTECRVEAPLERVWAFYDDLDSLGKITPPGIRMEVLYAERPIRAGSTILFRVKQHPLAPAYVWEALIVRHEPPHCFVDRMVRGPFKRFVHTHRFEALGVKATRLVDEVDYAAPLGPLGWIADRTVIPGQLRAMFAHRHRVTKTLLESS